MTDEELTDTLRSRLSAIETRIADACGRADRRRQDVTLVAVTKSVGLRVIRRIVSLGVCDLGENRPQSIERRSKACADLPIRWHMIGHLQRNKIDSLLPRVVRIHAADSQRLLDGLAGGNPATSPPVLIQFNISGEESKYGFAPEVVPTIPQSITVDGLMTMAPYEMTPERTRPVFRDLRELRDRLEQKMGRKLPQLSMGMSGDFECAIEEGATLVRIGSTLFEGLPDADEGE